VGLGTLLPRSSVIQRRAGSLRGGGERVDALLGDTSGRLLWQAPRVPSDQPKNPLHGVTLEQILNQLVEGIGWPEMAEAVHIRCFALDPSISSSLKFLRRTPWARAEVEALYLRYLTHRSRSGEARWSISHSKIVPRP